MKLLNGVQIIALILFTLALDQASKVIVRQTIPTGKTINLLGGHLNLTNIENEGAFLGLGDNLPPMLRLILLTIIPIFLIVFAIGYILTTSKTTRLGQIGASLLIGGGIGNLFDRVVYGSVTDFLHMDFGILQTGIFNVGDMAILAGVAMMLIGSYRKPKVGVKNESQQESDAARSDNPISSR